MVNSDIDGLEKVKILLVDDYDENLLALRAILSDPQYQLMTATSGRQALSMLLRDEFALILLDVMMPDMDGYETARFIRGREKTHYIPIIFLTAIATDMDHIFKGYSVGAVDYLLKPLAPDIVKAKVAVFADLYRKTQRIKEQEERLREHEIRAKQLEMDSFRRAQERRYHVMAESIPQMLWTWQTNGAFGYFNQRWLQYAGRDLVQARALGWLKFIHPDDADTILKGWQESLLSGRPFEAECRVLRAADGIYRWHLVRAVPIFEESERIDEWIGTFTDIEDQKNAEIELKSTLQSRDEFFSVASHELKTPLTSLALRVEIFEREIRKFAAQDSVPKVKVIELLGFVDGQLFRLGNLMDNLLDISRIRLKMFKVVKKKMDLVSVVEETASRLADQARLAGSQIRVRSAQGTIEGIWDKMRMEQVITNLLSNAIKYGNGLPIDVSIEAGDDLASVVVSDQGIGISKSDQARIFQPFERIATFSSVGGMGLGLFVVKQIIEAHGGSVHVESEIGKGSKFTIQIPRTYLLSKPRDRSPEASLSGV